MTQPFRFRSIVDEVAQKTAAQGDELEAQMQSDTVRAYLFCCIVYEVADCVEWACKQLRDMELTKNDRHLRDMLRRMDNAGRQLLIRLATFAANEWPILRIVCVEMHDYLTINRQKMYYAAYNYVARTKHPDCEMLALLAVIDMHCALLVFEIGDIQADKGSGARRLDGLTPAIIRKYLGEAYDRICDMHGEPYVGFHFNDCKDLETGLTIIFNKLTDLDTLQMVEAFAIEQTRGEETLKRESMESWEVLHPEWSR